MNKWYYFPYYHTMAALEFAFYRRSTLLLVKMFTKSTTNAIKTEGMEIKKQVVWHLNKGKTYSFRWIDSGPYLVYDD